MSEPAPSADEKALIAALAEQARGDAPEGPAPEPEELLDYLAGRLAPEDEQRIARQLAADPAAARALLDLAELEAAGAEAGERPTDLSAVASWRALRDRLPGGPARPGRLAALLPAVAASLLMTTLGFGSWTWRLWGELHRPIVNVVNLELVSGIRADGEKIRELPPGAVLRLVFPSAESCASYAAEVEWPRSGDRQTIEGLERDESGRVTFLLRRPKLGAYRLRLLGCEPRRGLEEHRFRLTAPVKEGPGG